MAKKKVIQSLVTEDEALAAMRLVTESAAKLKETESKVQQLKNEIDADYAEQLKQLKELVEQNEATVLKYAEENESKLFGDKKRIAFDFGELQVNEGKGQVTLKQGFDEAKVFKALEKHGLGNYIRTKKELNKQGILASMNNVEAKLWGKCGVVIMKEKTFKYKPNEKKSA